VDDAAVELSSLLPGAALQYQALFLSAENNNNNHFMDGPFS